MSVEFLLTSLVVILLPGTGVLYTVAVGLGRGFRPSVAAAFGCTLGILPAAMASIIGLSALLHTSALAFQVMKVIGALYLFYMAWSILKEHGALEVDEEKGVKSASRLAITGALINVLNPKLSLFFLAFLPQFIDPDASGAIAHLITLAFVFMAMTFVVFVGYGACAASARAFVIKRPAVLNWIRRCFAATFGFLGLRLALSE